MAVRFETDGFDYGVWSTEAVIGTQEYGSVPY